MSEWKMEGRRRRRTTERLRTSRRLFRMHMYKSTKFTNIISAARLLLLLLLLPKLARAGVVLLPAPRPDQRLPPGKCVELGQNVCDSASARGWGWWGGSNAVAVAVAVAIASGALLGWLSPPSLSDLSAAAISIQRRAMRPSANARDCGHGPALRSSSGGSPSSASPRAVYICSTSTSLRALSHGSSAVSSSSSTTPNAYASVFSETWPICTYSSGMYPTVPTTWHVEWCVPLSRAGAKRAVPKSATFATSRPPCWHSRMLSLLTSWWMSGGSASMCRYSRPRATSDAMSKRCCAVSCACETSFIIFFFFSSSFFFLTSGSAAAASRPACSRVKSEPPSMYSNKRQYWLRAASKL